MLEDTLIVEKKVVSAQIEEEERICHKILGRFLISVSVMNFIEILAKLVLRYTAGDEMFLVMSYEATLGVSRLILVVSAFMYCLKNMKKMYFHSPAVRKLLVLWGVILIPVQVINDMVGMLYTRMLQLIQIAFLTSGTDTDGKMFAMIYDMTHGFKYVCLFLAILIGVVMTGEILDRKILILLSGLVAVLFMVAFTVLRMGSVSIDAMDTYEIGVNWTSMIFHVLNTVGLFSVGLYIDRVFGKKKQ